MLLHEQTALQLTQTLTVISHVATMVTLHIGNAWALVAAFVFIRKPPT